MPRQAKHCWNDWDVIADDYFRHILWMGYLPEKHTILYSANTLGDVIEFEQAMPDRQRNRRISRSFARFVFPNLQHARWHRSAGSITIVEQPGILRWLNENLNTALWGINAGKLLYITTDDLDDFALIKLRCREYSIQGQ